MGQRSTLMLEDRKWLHCDICKRSTSLYSITEDSLPLFETRTVVGWQMDWIGSKVKFNLCYDFSKIVE